ncbi:hypothetical protein ACFOSC_27880 [Streptantibioticus rubrisoli]|uniref:Helix-turn-helix domain-containing protein n=1 Tax=Streptantibioticus rubrisoli TaxID=1387313 RepID=A0ABT1PMN1_9ACTN|nr:hypothetical protein [Streptantibioticus rubrisoli]MCQ4045828.1 hypothetical protein [Streptantibioticus rubrisoli]
MNDETDQQWDGSWEELTVPVPLAASMLGISPCAVVRLATAGHLEDDVHRSYRFITLTSLFAYRRVHWSAARAARYTVALDDATALDHAADQLAG